MLLNRNLLDVLIVIQMFVDIVVEHMIANYDQYLKQLMDLFDDENFLNVVVMRMDHEHWLMNHVVHYEIFVLLLMMFY